jgi:hypothetical protein
VGKAGSRQNPSAEGELRDQGQPIWAAASAITSRSFPHDSGALKYSAPVTSVCGQPEDCEIDRPHLLAVADEVIELGSAASATGESRGGWAARVGGLNQGFNLLNLCPHGPSDRLILACVEPTLVISVAVPPRSTRTFSPAVRIDSGFRRHRCPTHRVTHDKHQPARRLLPG